VLSASFYECCGAERWHDAPERQFLQGE